MNPKLKNNDNDMALHCTICQQEIPEARARRGTSTCSESCKNKFDRIRAEQRALRKCPHCLHPSTPEERSEFRVWRAERGDNKSAHPTGPRDHTLPNKNLILSTLRKATQALREERDAIQQALETLQTPPEGAAEPANGIPGDGAEADSQTASAKLGEVSPFVRLEMLTSLVMDAEKLLARPTKDVSAQPDQA